jgi:prolyl oligopeptidase
MTARRAARAADPYLWLEKVDSARALAWVRERNAATLALLRAEPGYEATRTALLDALDSSDRIPTITRRGDLVYNFWQDETHKRGLWRRTTLADFANAEPLWEPVLDLDALGAAERRSWVWDGAQAFGPQYRRCLVSLSDGGADAVVVREFDLIDKRFVDDGFVLPEAKTDVDWCDADTICVATDFGPGSLTESGYPRVIKRWTRGTPLADAVTVFEGEVDDVSVWVTVDRTPGFERTVFGRSLDFYNDRCFLLQHDGTLAAIDKPADADLSFERDWLLLDLRSDWEAGGVHYRSGSLLAAPAADYLRGERRLHCLFEPTPTCSLGDFDATRSHLLLTLIDDVASRVEELHWDGAAWQRRAVPVPPFGAIEIDSLHDPLIEGDPLGDAYLVDCTDFLTPDTLWLARAGGDERRLLKQRDGLFDASGMRAEQRFATSADGTRVPYFVVWPNGARADGANPVLLYGYGGFEEALQPWYSAAFGRAWYARGGVFVVANTRGGGEYGPAWHQAATKAGRQRSFDDFIAVAEDLVRVGVTVPQSLGIMGGSNGGLLVAAVALQRPELFGAVVCQVPLLDMRRYHRLLAGASWMAEYGDPDDAADWAAIARYSPYHNLRADLRYPPMLLTTSTRDDRVHPGHARKMAALMQEQGHDVLYYENIEGGHGGAADHEQQAIVEALEFAFLWRTLRRPG